MSRAQIALIIPLGDAPPGLHPDQGLPGGGDGHRPEHPIYHPGHPDHGLPAHPDQGLPGGGGGPDQGLPGRPPRPSHPIAPGGRPVDPGFGWGGGERPGNRPPRPERPTDPGYGQGEEHPDNTLPPELGPPVGPTQPWVPPSGEELPPPPEDIADKVVLAVWRPDQQEWKVVVAEGPQPAPTD
jgi:hypothetical protein